MNEETKAALLVEDLQDRTFKAFMALLIGMAIMLSVVGIFVVKQNEETICQHVLPEARTLTCENDDGTN